MWDRLMHFSGQVFDAMKEDSAFEQALLSGQLPYTSGRRFVIIRDPFAPENVILIETGKDDEPEYVDVP